MSAAAAPVIYWFRRDLRLSDLPALAAAAASGHPVLPVYIIDDDSPGEWRDGGASRWWLHHSLAALDAALRDMGSALLVRRGESARELAALVTESGAEAVYCSEGYEPFACRLQQRLATGLPVPLRTHPGPLLFHPDAIRNLSGDFFRVFTPFWKNCLRQSAPAAPLPAPKAAAFCKPTLAGLVPAQWALRPTQPDWAAHWGELWQPGEAGARKALARFARAGLAGYDEQRDLPGVAGTSRLSPHLHFGEISPRQVWHTVAGNSDHARFLAELGWREFNHHLLYHAPHIADQPFKAQFREFPWLGNPDHLKAWQRGETGYPLVDAGMRELWHTGFMHNRVRMVCASFLTKHLLLPWQWGARWFWDTLVDADLANNSGGWQWSAGCGADAAPYFRIFNPELQGQKFDPQGAYVKRWVPELAEVAPKFLYRPHAAGTGLAYPEPLVEHKAAREAALAAYATVKAG